MCCQECNGMVFIIMGWSLIPENAIYWSVDISLSVWSAILKILRLETHVVKLLGVKIESELTFNTHIEILCRKASQKLNALSR